MEGLAADVVNGHGGDSENGRLFSVSMMAVPSVGHAARTPPTMSPITYPGPLALARPGLSSEGIVHNWSLVYLICERNK
jgi:hypothetical protein